MPYNAGLRETAGGLEEQEGLAYGRHVVDAQDLHALSSQRKGRADRAGRAIRRRLRCRVADESLPRRADEHGAAERVELPGVSQKLEIVLGRFAEADARIHRDPLAVDSGGQQGVAASARYSRTSATTSA